MTGHGPRAEATTGADEVVSPTLRLVEPGEADDQPACPPSDEDLVRSYREGWAAAADRLLARYHQLTWIRARSYFLTGGDEDDLVQEGLIGLYKAIRDFDPDRQVSFRTFALVCINRQIISAIRATQRHKHLPLNAGVSLSKPLDVGEDADRSLSDVLDARAATDPADTVIVNEEVRQVKAALSDVLSAFEAEVLHQLTEGYSYHEIAARLGRQVKSIDNALQRIRRKVKGHSSVWPADLKQIC